MRTDTGGTSPTLRSTSPVAVDTRYVYPRAIPGMQEARRVSRAADAAATAILVPGARASGPRPFAPSTRGHVSCRTPARPQNRRRTRHAGDQPDAAEPQPYNPYPDSWESSGTPPTPPPPAQNPYEQNPYGQAPDASRAPYGQPAQPYGQPPYGGVPGQPGAPANPYAGSANPNKPTFGFGGYAGWFTRVGAYLLDYICGALAGLPAIVGYVILLTNTTTTTNLDGTTTTDYSGSIGVPIVLILIGAVTGIAFFVWNICIRQGRTGASIGKSVLAIRLVNSDLQPIGAGWSFLRYLLHILDGICYIGYLWPIWDSRKQTFADKIMNTFVIQATAEAPRPY